jgi:hypothetical protein
MGEKRWSRRQQMFLEAMLVCGSVAEAARRANLSETHGYRLLHSEHFIQKFNEIRQESLGLAIAQAQRLSALAIQTLRGICEDESAPASARVAAAGKILDLSVETATRESERERAKAIQASLQEIKEERQQAAKERPALEPWTEGDQEESN